MITVPYLRVANVQDGYLDLTEIKTIEIRENEVDRFSLRPKDVLLTEGVDFDKLGRGFLWADEVPGCIHQNHVFAVRADQSRLMPEYLAYLTQSTYGKRYFLNVAHRTTHLACINTRKLKALPIPLPSLMVQGQIAGILASVDQKLEVEQSRERALDSLFNTLLYDLMTGKRRVHELEIDENQLAGVES